MNNGNNNRNGRMQTMLLGIASALVGAMMTVMLVWRADAREHEALPAHSAMQASFNALEKRITETVQPSLFAAFEALRARETAESRMQLSLDDVILRIRALEVRQ